jgi:hypothetical protein
MGWVPLFTRCFSLFPCGRLPLKEALNRFQHFGCSSCPVHASSKLAAVPHAMAKPAGELLHFAYTIGQVGTCYFAVVAEK